MNARILVVCVLLLLAAAGTMTAQNVVMNEIYSRGVAGNLDWIEIYNPSNSPVDLSGYAIYDIGAGSVTPTKTKKKFPAGTIIPAKGFYTIITDTAAAGDFSGFGLSSSGEKVWLEDTTTSTIIDTITYGATATAAQSYGRGPDGGKWTVLNTITRNTSNGKIVMNEIYSRGVAGNLDWIEIYNGVSASVNISGYAIYDIGAGALTPTKTKKHFPSGTIIAEKGFFVIITDTTDFTGDLSGFGLSSSGEKVWLEDTTTSTIMDTVTYGATATTAQSYGRSPDGGAWQVLNTITRGATNGGSTAVEEEAIPTSCQLLQNYPNPFNPGTVIRYQVSVVSEVRLGVFDLLGREVATLVNFVQNPGTYSVNFDASRLPSGVYLYRLNAGTFSEVKRMMLVK